MLLNNTLMGIADDKYLLDIVTICTIMQLSVVNLKDDMIVFAFLTFS